MRELHLDDHYGSGGGLVKFPDFLKILKIDLNRYENYKLPKLPNNLEHLIIRSFKDRELEIPPSVKYLGIYVSFNIKTFPENLETLILFLDQDRELPKFPTTLRHLTLVYLCNISSLPKLPDELESLQIYHDINISPSYKFPDNLPNKLQKLTCDWYGNLQKLPDNLVELRLTDISPRKLDPLPELPQTLQILILSANYNHPLGKLPTALKTICFYSNDLISVMPTNLQNIIVLNPIPDIKIHRDTKIYAIRKFSHSNYQYGDKRECVDGIMCFEILNYPRHNYESNNDDINVRLSMLEKQIDKIMSHLQ